MKIGLLLHNPYLIDSGNAKNILTSLSKIGTIDAKIAGTMGKTAVFDEHLENKIDTCCNKKPSEIVTNLLKKNDIAILLNHGKSLYSGVRFASIVASKISNLQDKPVIHIERPGCFDETIFPMNDNALEYITTISSLLNIKHSTNIIKPYKIKVHKKNNVQIRRIEGTYPGENIFINGLIVGKAQNNFVDIIVENGILTKLEGGILKEHGIEKLHKYNKKCPIDLENVWIKTGKLRNFNKPTKLNNRFKSFNDNKLIIIDHDAENIYKYISGTTAAISIGDDTTSIASEILFRFSIPVLGIVDGDLDCKDHNTRYFTDSTIYVLKKGHDDILGEKIKQNIFNNNKYVNYSDFESIKSKIKKLGSNIIETTIDMQFR